MENKTTLEKLSDKISTLLAQFHSLKSENEMLRSELIVLKSEREEKEAHIQKLVQDNALKDMEIEEIANNIENILG